MSDTGILNADPATSGLPPFPQAGLMPPPKHDPFSETQRIHTGASFYQHSSEEWEFQRPEITRLYVDKKLPLREVMDAMRTQHGFYGTKKQYKDRIEKWSINVKNFKAPEMKAVVRKMQRRKWDEKKESAFRIRGRKVEPEKIEKFIKRNGIQESAQSWPTSPAASTPSVISYYTPSVRGPSTPGEMLSPAAMTLTGNSENHPQSSQFPSIDCFSRDDSMEGGFSSRLWRGPIASHGPGYGLNAADALATHTIVPISAPMMSAVLSTHSKKSYRFYPTDSSVRVAQNFIALRRLSQDFDPRLFSEEWLLSGYPRMLQNPNSKDNYTVHYDLFPSLSGNGECSDEATTWEEDRSFRNLDISWNDVITSGNTDTRQGRRNFQSGNFFGAYARDLNFEENDYCARPVKIKIPRSFEPLPALLMENSINLLYFHHFISYTARLLAHYHCRSNPFQNILPRMAIQDKNLMNLLLVYSASHRAQLLQQPEPTARIVKWAKDFFRKLRHALNNIESGISNANLAMAVMLASLQIFSPKTFGVSVSWRQHLLTARSMVMARGGVQGMYSQLSSESSFLWCWFVYHDFLGSFIVGKADSPSPKGSLPSQRERSKHMWLYGYDFGYERDYQVTCLLGFSGCCLMALVRISELAHQCDLLRVDIYENTSLEWVPSEQVIAQAKNLIVDLEAARTNFRLQLSPHLLSAEKTAYQRDARKVFATNEAYHWAGLVHLHQRVLGKSTKHADVKNAVSEIITALCDVRNESSAELHLLFPMFTAGCNTHEEKHKEFIIDRFRSIESLGMSQVQRARILMQKVWDTGKPWQTLVSTEFVG